MFWPFEAFELRIKREIIFSNLFKNKVKQ